MRLLGFLSTLWPLKKPLSIWHQSANFYCRFADRMALFRLRYRWAIHHQPASSCCRKHATNIFAPVVISKQPWDNAHRLDRTIIEMATGSDKNQSTTTRSYKRVLHSMTPSWCVRKKIQTGSDATQPKLPALRSDKIAFEIHTLQRCNYAQRSLCDGQAWNRLMAFSFMKF